MMGTEMDTMPMTDRKTLGQRMMEGRLAVVEALRYAMLLADALRRVHDTGRAHGAVTPGNLTLTRDGLELGPAAELPTGEITPYTAPELLLGRAPDARSDIFSFGAILFEMVTGRKAFEGEGRATLAANLANAPTPSSGSPALDKLVTPCLTKDPAERVPRMQKVMMELKLLSVAVRRAEAAGPRRPVVDLNPVRSEMQEMEARLDERLANQVQFQGHIAAEIQKAANEQIESLKSQIAVLTAELAEARERAAGTPSPDVLIAEAGERILARVDRGFEAVSEHMAGIERTIEDVKQHSQQFEQTVAADLTDVEQQIKVQSAAIESARGAMAQTDDLVERVVEALESLQTAVLDTGDGPGEHAAFAVN